MTSFSIDQICHFAHGVYLELVHGPDRGMLPALADALVEHARCVCCDAPPSPPLSPCKCGRKPADGLRASFDFVVAPDIWRDILEPLWKRERRRATGRNTSRLRKEAIGNSPEPAHTEEDIACLRRLQNDRCYYCGGSIHATAQVEHLDPLSRGGSNGFRNLMLACPSCNSAKGALNESQYWRRLQKSLAPARFSRLHETARLMKRSKRYGYGKAAACAFGCPVGRPDAHRPIRDP